MDQTKQIEKLQKMIDEGTYVIPVADLAEIIMSGILDTQEEHTSCDNLEDILG